MPIALLANGCLCCQVGDDLGATVEALLEAGDVRRIVLETSGLSRPGPVLRQVAGLRGVAWRLAVIATFDAVRGTGVGAFAEAAAQWGAAQRIVATRVDLSGVEGVAAAISGVNPLAEVVVTGDRGAAVEGAFAPLVGAAMGALGEGVAHPLIAVRLARPLGKVTAEGLAAWLDNVAGALGERLLRVKGVVRVVEGVSLLVQGVGTMFAPLRSFRGEGSFLVVIAHGLREGELEGVSPGLFRFSAWGERGMFGAKARGGILRALP